MNIINQYNLTNETIKDIYYINQLDPILKLKDNNVYKVGEYLILNGKIKKEKGFNMAYNFSKLNTSITKKELDNYIKDSYNLTLQLLNKNIDSYNIKNISGLNNK